MAYTLGEAAKATGVSKASLSRAISSGRVSATRNSDGSFSIEPVELHRVYPLKQPVTGSTTPQGNIRNTADVNVLQAKLDGMTEQLRDRDQAIDDLRQRLDRSEEERREAQARVMGLLTGSSYSEKKTSLIGRLFGR